MFFLRHDRRHREDSGIVRETLPSHHGAQWHTSHGFTLLELMISLGIFSIIGVAMFTQFNQVMKAKAITDAHAKRLTEVQRAMAVLDRDFSQVIARTSRDEFGDAQPALLSSGGDSIEFTRVGRSITPFSKGARSDIQRVRYGFEGGTLVRAHWDHPDKGGDDAPRSGVLLSGVENVAFSFWGFKEEQNSVAYGERQLEQSDQWPPLSTGFGDDKASAGIPKLVEIELELEKMGKLTRLFSLVDSVPYIVADPT